ncbi:AraC family transcriptional regulator [Flavitalea flava]
MKPVLEHLPLEPEESFVAKFFDYPYYPTPWHFHPEYELVLVTESTGKRFIGDNISNFKPGDLSFIGPDLPHLFRNDPSWYKPKSRLRAKSIVIHFSENSFGKDFFNLPETAKLQALLARSVKGLEITGKTNEKVSKNMHELLQLKGLARWMKLVDILHTLSGSRDWRAISSTHLQGKNELESDRLNAIFEFVMKNFKHNISVTEAARIVNLAENSFSRYFSKRTRKSFTGFVNEIRLHHACQLLKENKSSISAICFECGFNNLSNFNRQFKNTYQMSPLVYRKTITGQ